LNTHGHLLQPITEIKLPMGLPAMCERLVSAGKALESLSEPLSQDMRVSLGDEFQRLMDALSTASPTLLDPVPLITLVSTIPMTVRNVNRVAGHASTVSNHDGQEQVVSQLVHAMVENLKRYQTIEHEMKLVQAANPRFAGDILFKITDFESDLVTIPFELAWVGYEDNIAKEYLDHIFSLDISDNDASMDPKGHAIAAILEAGRDDPERAAPAWPGMKRWLEDNKSLVTQRLLASGWNHEYKPKLHQKAEKLGLPWLSAVLIKRGFRFNPEDLIELEIKHSQSPDLGTYETSFLGPDGKPAPADDKTLIAMLAHALVYENVMPDDWMTHENSSALKLLRKAMGVLSSQRIEADPERLKPLFDLCSRKLRKDDDLEWLVNSEFKHLLTDSLGYKGVKFTQELGI